MKEYARKEFSLISVKGLCAATPVARTTFYSYYNNTDDVRREIEDEVLNGLGIVTDSISGGNLQDMDFSIYMDAVESYIKEHWTDIYAFLVKQPNLRFIRRWKDAIKLNFSRRYPDKRHIKNYEAIAEILASSMISAYSYWMEHPDTSSTAEMKLIIGKLLDSLVTWL